MSRTSASPASVRATKLEIVLTRGQGEIKEEEVTPKTGEEETTGMSTEIDLRKERKEERRTVEEEEERRIDGKIEEALVALKKEVTKESTSCPLSEISRKRS